MRLKSFIAVRLVQLVGGLVVFGAGTGLMFRGAVGVPPWDVLAQGISLVTGQSFGLITILIGAGVLLLWIPLKQKLGLGTVLNVLLIGIVAQITLNILPVQESLYIRIPLFIVGILLVAIGTGLYIGASFGPGPRDGLMTGLHRVTGLPIWIVRSAIEISVLVVGWLLGGNVGVGTVAFAFLIGPLAQPAMKWFDLTKSSTIE